MEDCLEHPDTVGTGRQKERNQGRGIEIKVILSVAIVSDGLSHLICYRI